jgi:hypothetical protein
MRDFPQGTKHLKSNDQAPPKSNLGEICRVARGEIRELRRAERNRRSLTQEAFAILEGAIHAEAGRPTLAEIR